jgi:hypothetical protein
MLANFADLQIAVNTHEDIDKSLDDDLSAMARNIGRETLLASEQSSDGKRYVYNAGHFNLDGVEKKIYYVCGFDRDKKKMVIYFSHTDAIFKKAYANYQAAPDADKLERPSTGPRVLN